MTKRNDVAVDADDIPTLGLDWQVSRWGADDQRGNGNLMNPAKVLEASRLIRTGEIVSLGHPYDAAMPLAPGRSFALRMPGGPTGGPEGNVSRTIWNDEFIATEIGQIGTHMDALGHLGCQCGAKGDRTNMLFYNGNRLSDMWTPYGLKKLGIENAPPFFTRGVLFDVQGLKGRVLDVGEEVKLADLKACLKRQNVAEKTITPGDAAFIRTGQDHAGAPTPQHFMTAPPALASNARAGSPTSKSVSSAPIISPSTSCRRPIRRCFTRAISTSS
jgi:Putative cyclase